MPPTSAPGTTFASLGVPSDISDALARAGITAPFEIQEAAIPDALEGRDVLGRAPTGSGKTLAFGIPMVALLEPARAHHPTGLILSPTRELAEQIRKELAPLAEVRRRSVAAVYGGVGFGPQLKALRQGVDMLVACPGRLLDLIEQGEVALDEVSIAVVDEADRMADMGFLPVVKRILDATSDDRQTVLFSATLGKEVRVLTDRYQQDPVRHEVGDREPDMTRMTHRFVRIDRTEKVSLAAHEIRTHGQTIVFCRTRHGSDRVARQLKKYGVKTGVIHGRRTQNQRDSALRAFVDGKTQALVATDVAARGIHVDGVDCVVHFDPPEDHKAYTHRSGRTARAGATGVVVSFVTNEQVKDTKRLQRQIKVRCEFEDPTPKADLDLGEAISPPKTGEQRTKRSGSKQKQGRRDGKPRGKAPSPTKSKSNGKPKQGGKSHSGGKPKSNGKPKSGGKPKSNRKPKSKGKSHSNNGSGKRSSANGQRPAAKRSRPPAGKRSRPSNKRRR